MTHHGSELMARYKARELCAKYFHIVGVPAIQNSSGIDTCHLSWMLGEIINHSHAWPEDKFWRWVGYAQCLMAVHGFRSLEKLREDMR